MGGRDRGIRRNGPSLGMTAHERWWVSHPSATLIVNVVPSMDDRQQKLEAVESAVFSADAARYLAKAQEQPIVVRSGGEIVMVVAGLARLDSVSSEAKKL
jgi:hypothetical protein